MRSAESGTYLVIHSGTCTSLPSRSHTEIPLRAAVRGTGGHPIGSHGSHLSSSAHQLDPRTSGVARGGGACAPQSGETDERGSSACAPPMGFQTRLLESLALDVNHRMPVRRQGAVGLLHGEGKERIRDTDALAHRVGWEVSVPNIEPVNSCRRRPTRCRSTAAAYLGSSGGSRSYPREPPSCKALHALRTILVTKCRECDSGWS